MCLTMNKNAHTLKLIAYSGNEHDILDNVNFKLTMFVPNTDVEKNIVLFIYILPFRSSFNINNFTILHYLVKVLSQFC